MLTFPAAAALPPDQAARLPTEADCAAYAQRGWHVSDAIVPAGLLDAAAEDIARYRRGERDASIPAQATQRDWVEGAAQVIRINGYLSLQMRAVRDLVAYPAIAAIAGRLARTREIRLFHDRLIVKPGGLPAASTETGWHTDVAYWGNSSSTELLTAWIPLADCSVNDGTLAVVEGSHHWPTISLERRFLTPDFDGQVPRTMVPDAVEPVVRVLPVTRGQVVFHHSRVLHRSVPNLGTAPRIALAVHLQDEANRHQPWIQPNGRRAMHSNELLCRPTPGGAPDFADPRVFPVLWRE
ncbi:phytanoyl-CoA dioxygenase family protein [Burkholderia stagnalis]|uniref:phytanoyl-CoA dioxygenase family protein n=1 Tax=Burkholderia stagnalis TaxID=1503054 RepID=UPI0007600FF6|nr:phytanoyl-CoA dioxygenase family protein [Burkholderia stagnalis]KWK06416.1 phytanoyl-CoA dioxygenase [Burkholderia stagnalis]KWO26657.1 phytanoyl-CoA dioxygenase [Burkholderia stagnalis]